MILYISAGVNREYLYRGHCAYYETLNFYITAFSGPLNIIFRDIDIIILYLENLFNEHVLLID